MSSIHAAITAVGGYVPDDIITNADIERMVDTSDEWITTRVGIKERRILKDPTKGSSYLGIKAVQDMLERHNIDPKSIEFVICSTNVADYNFPATATIIAHETGCTEAGCIDMQAACPGFVYAMEMGSSLIMSGRYKKVLIVAAEKMTSVTDYTDRETCALFGDAGACVLLEPCTPEYGFQDSILRSDGSGKDYLIMKAGGSACPTTHETVDQHLHYIHQEGKHVFKAAVTQMGDTTLELMQRNNLSKDDIAWIVPHQANMRIIDAVARRAELPLEKVMINIQKYGNTSSVTIPLCLWEWESKLHKGDKLILTAFGAGYLWGATYIIWAYDYKPQS